MDAKWGLRTSQIRPAAIEHPRSGEIVWFNQADQWHPSNLPESIRAAVLSITGEADLPTNAYYGDGSPIEVEPLDAVRAAFAKVVMKFPWQQGDVLLVDNMLTTHGRASFAGPRKVVLAMGGGSTWGRSMHCRRPGQGLQLRGDGLAKSPQFTLRCEPPRLRADCEGTAAPLRQEHTDGSMVHDLGP